VSDMRLTSLGVSRPGTPSRNLVSRIVSI
jgi:hypothetical protein